jgi:hypothetical protein
MRKLLTLFALFCLALPAFAGTSAVTATITDSDSQTWNNGTFTVTFVPLVGTSASIYNVNGASFTQQFSGTMNGSGVLSVTLTDLSTITPTGGQWKFTLCPLASFGCSSGNTSAVVGATPNLSAQLSAFTVAPRFSASPISYGYADVELISPTQPGASYWNVTSTSLRFWNGSAWVSSSSALSYPILAPDGTAGAPTYSFASDPTTGIFRFGTSQLSLAAGGTEAARVRTFGIQMALNSELYWAIGATTVGLDSQNPNTYIEVNNGAAGNSQGHFRAASFSSGGTTFTASGCANSTLVGGASAGTYTSVTAGSCTVTITMGNTATAPHGWVCDAHDLTTVADANNVTMGSSTTTTANLVEGTVAANDVISFKCVGY